MYIPFLAHPGVRIERLAPSEAANGKAWAAAIASFDADRRQVLKQDGGTLVCRTQPTVSRPRDVIVKCWDLSTIASRIKSLAGHSRAFRHWRGAQWLEARGLATARCLALLTEYRHGRPRQYLVMEALDGASVLDHLSGGQLKPRQEHAIARAIARQLVSLTLAGRYNRDHKPSNLIVLNPDSPDPTIAIIDTVAINKLRPWRRADLYTMFASLVIEPTGCGCPPRRALMMRVLVEHQRELLRRIADLLPADPVARKAARHIDWMRIAGMVADHGDLTPRVSPLRNADS